MDVRSLHVNAGRRLSQQVSGIVSVRVIQTHAALRHVKLLAKLESSQVTARMKLARSALFNER
jgi:hypothetical protein